MLNYKQLNVGYAEESQPNPLRWALLSKQPDGTFNNVSNWLKCKDFFNDFCVAYNGGKRFSIYSFSTKDMPIPAKGEPVYIAVDVLTKAFASNLAHFSTWLTAQGLPPVRGFIDNISILEFDPFFFANTYNTSLVSLIIRLCNVEVAFTSFQALVEYKGFATKDQNKWDVVVKKGVFFNIPEQFKDYVWYVDKNHNSSVDVPEYQLPSLVHNNGVLDWSRSFT